MAGHLQRPEWHQKNLSFLAALQRGRFLYFEIPSMWHRFPGTSCFMAMEINNMYFKPEQDTRPSQVVMKCLNGVCCISCVVTRLLVVSFGDKLEFVVTQPARHRHCSRQRCLLMNFEWLATYYNYFYTTRTTTISPTSISTTTTSTTTTLELATYYN